MSIKEPEGPDEKTAESCTKEPGWPRVKTAISCKKTVCVTAIKSLEGHVKRQPWAASRASEGI